MNRVFDAFERAKARMVALVAAALFFVCACGPPINVKPLETAEIPLLQAPGNYVDEKYVILPDDTLQIRYVFHPDMNQEAVVQPDGKINAPLAGQVSVVGMTTMKLEQVLKEKTSDQLRDPEVIVNITKFAERTVYIGGEVAKPGMVRYRRGLTPLQAVIASGGFLDSARADNVILIRNGDPGSEFISRKLNLTETVLDSRAEPLFLAPHDVVFVPKTPIAEANLWVKQNITDLLPFLFPSVGSATGVMRSMK
jgi:protein involved in polysaccharide export with SLBB domain